MFLISGLGNPGDTYAGHRHNLGFRFIEGLARHFSFGAWRRKFHADFTEGRLGAGKVALLKPQTYMNRSGFSLKEAVRFFKLEPGDILVVHDELDLKLGQFRLKVGGGDGGHRGIKSISEAIGRDYARLRVGIGRPPEGWQTSNWVLGNFLAEELMILEPLLVQLVKEAPQLAAKEWSLFANRVHLARQAAK